MPDLDAAMIARRCAALVREHYVFTGLGEQLGETLDRGAAEGRYDDASGDPAALSDLLTADLQSVSNDRHLRLLHHVDPLPDLQDDAAEMAMYSAMARDAMNGVRRVERLEGNVGLLCLAPMLFPAAVVGAAVCAAMNVLAHSSALIIDLRDTLGGDPATVALVCSYLVDEPTHLNSLVARDGSSTQSWTLPWVPGARFGATRPVWVLTSRATFSGGEELAYDLQQLNRATIVGEVTGGGAHAREGFTVVPHLELSIPVAAGHNPKSGTNWEGGGVIPDVAVPAGDALGAALGLAHAGHGAAALSRQQRGRTSR
ncbi:MAG: S41 family peptidase [Janthinobacterium lividum]